MLHLSYFILVDLQCYLTQLLDCLIWDGRYSIDLLLLFCFWFLLMMLFLYTPAPAGVSTSPPSSFYVTMITVLGFGLFWDFLGWDFLVLGSQQKCCSSVAAWVCEYEMDRAGKVWHETVINMGNVIRLMYCAVVPHGWMHFTMCKLW